MTIICNNTYQCGLRDNCPFGQNTTQPWFPCQHHPQAAPMQVPAYVFHNRLMSYEEFIQERFDSPVPKDALIKYFDEEMNEITLETLKK